MSHPSFDPVDSIKSAIAIGNNGLITNPFDLIGLIASASEVESPSRELLWRRLFLEAPLPYWNVVNWAKQVTESQLTEIASSTVSTGWESLQPSTGTIVLREVFTEIAKRFDEFDPDLYSWERPDPNKVSLHRLKYLLGRDLARSYVQEQIPNGPRTSRSELLASNRAAWQEWIEVNEKVGYHLGSVCEATSLALDHVVSRQVTPGINGIGRSHILLEQLNVNLNSTSAIITANILPLTEQHQHLDGILVPDLRENGLLVIAPDFLEGVSKAWQYARRATPSQGPSMLCFSVRPKLATVIQDLSGRSAELASLAAIESALKEIVLRPDAAASATLEYSEPEVTIEDPKTGRASFENKKFSAAKDFNISTVVVNTEVAREWKTIEQQISDTKRPNDPDVLASEFYRRDALQILETKSLWKLSYYIPGAITLAFIVMAVCFWQFYKMSASPVNADYIVHEAKLPFVVTALVVSEMLTLVLCLLIGLTCHRSIRRSLDSERSAWIALAVSSVIVLLSQYLPIGVRYEGLLDTPLYSVLFGEPQITPQLVIAAGGLGFLLMHTTSQTAGFIAILFGVSAFTIRLILTRAHSEPIYEDRCELLKKDWRFSVALMVMLMAVVMMFCLTRNVFWYYYLTTLPNVPMIDNGGSLLLVVVPLLTISLVIILSVGLVWIFVMQKYLANVVRTAQGRSGYTTADVVATMPPLARLLYHLKPID